MKAVIALCAIVLNFLCLEVKGYRQSSSYGKEEFEAPESEHENLGLPFYQHVNKEPQRNKGDLISYISAETVQITERIRSALSVNPVDEETLIEVFSKLTPAKAQKLEEFYNEFYFGNLKDEIGRKLSGPFMRVILSFFMKPRELDVYWINQALEAPNVDKSTLIGIFSALHNEDLADAKEMYDQEHFPSLLQEIKIKLTGNFKKLMFTLANSYRQMEGHVEDRLAKKDAMDLAGKLASTDPKDIFINVFSTRSFETLRATFEYFKQYADTDIKLHILTNFNGDFKDTLFALATRAQNKDRFFVNLLSNSLNKSNYNLLTWVIISRSKPELDNIITEYSRDHFRTLLHDIYTKTSGNFQKMMLALIQRR